MKQGYETISLDYIVLSMEELKKLLCELFNKVYYNSFDDGHDEDLEEVKLWCDEDYGDLYWSIDGVNDEQIFSALTEYFEVKEVFDIVKRCPNDIEDTDVCIKYEDKGYQTSAGVITTELYDDGCAKGIQIKLDDEIVAMLDVYEPEDGEDEGEARVLVYRGDSDEPTDVILINR